MYIEKFRLGWRSAPSQQYDALQTMVMQLTNMANSMTDINVKLNALPIIVTTVNNQSLLLQAIADNTACACNGLSQVNDNLVTINNNIGAKLDYIAGLIESGATPPAGDVYLFELFLTSVELTQDIIDAGSFILTGVTRKNGAIFDELSLIDHYDFIDSISVLAPGQIEVQLVPGVEMPYGTFPLQIQQAESGIVQQLNIYYAAPPVPVVNYLVLNDDTVVPLFTSGDIDLISTAAASSTTITVGGVTFYKNQVKSIVIADGSMFRLPYVTPDNFCKNFNQLTSIQLPDDLVGIGTYFLSNCQSFNAPFAVPPLVVSLGSYFLDGCITFNSPVTLPEGLVTIGANFLGDCRLFNQYLKLPFTLSSVADGFMVNCWSFTGILDIGSLLPSVFTYGLFVLSVADPLKDMYAIGVYVVGDNADAFRTKFFNVFNSSAYHRYRNLLSSALILTPANSSFIAQGETKPVQLLAAVSWHYVGYKDSDGNSYPGLPDWLHADNIASGDHGIFNFEFTADANTANTIRSVELVFEADDDPKGNLTAYLTIAQDGAVAPISITVDNFGSVNPAYVSVALYPGSFNWNQADIHVINGGDSAVISSDDGGGEFAQGDTYKLYYKYDSGVSGEVLINEMEDGLLFRIGEN